MIPVEKLCTWCNQVKLATEFYVVQGKWLFAYCTECNRERARLRRLASGDVYAFDRHSHLLRHHLTLESYEALLESQGGVCAICGTDTPGKGLRRFHIDHNHTCCPTTGKSCGKCIRGLLCSACNLGIGKLHDDPKLLLKAVEYLERST